MEDWELLAVLFGTGSKGKDVETLSRELLSENKNLARCIFLDQKSLFSKKGIGKAKIAKLVAIRELIHRIRMHQLVFENTSNEFDISKLAEALYQKTFTEKRECFYLLNFDQRGNLIYQQQIAKGSLSEVGIKMRDIIKLILEDSASSVLIAHNHPMNLSVPSEEDWNLYDELKNFLQKLDITLYDQWVMGIDGIFSCRGNRLLAF